MTRRFIPFFFDKITRADQQTQIKWVALPSQEYWAVLFDRYMHPRFSGDDYVHRWECLDKVGLRSAEKQVYSVRFYSMDAEVPAPYPFMKRGYPSSIR